MSEKLLFEIAIGRLLERIGKADRDVQNDVILIIRDAADGKLSDLGKKVGRIDWMIKNLFPELGG